MYAWWKTDCDKPWTRFSLKYNGTYHLYEVLRLIVLPYFFVLFQFAHILWWPSASFWFIVDIISFSTAHGLFSQFSHEEIKVFLTVWSPCFKLSISFRRCSSLVAWLWFPLRVAWKCWLTLYKDPRQTFRQNSGDGDVSNKVGLRFMRI